MAPLRTPFQGFSVRFSPFEEDKLAVATSQNFGIIGNGKQHVVAKRGGQGPTEIAAYDTADGLYDCAWSEENENVLVSASGDGSIKAWDVSASAQANPLRSYHEHTHEVYSVAWNLVGRDTFLSASWDNSLKLWRLDAPGSLRTFKEHTYCVYAATWSPSQADVFASASGDCTVKLWDLRAPTSTLTIAAHDYEVLTADWNKYNDHLLASGSVDKTIRVWDTRFPNRPVTTMVGHKYAVRRVICSPHKENIILSCSYDMSVCLWDTMARDAEMVRRFDHHTEFAVGIDMSVLVEGLVASTGWDGLTYVWHLSQDPRMV